ncbi:MAG TPA: 16S rRNA (adenine(1518)-N(6)/adenine(1519)-N(6))-dimethyltransferase RsmA [Polyangia bacterium]|nr:16S rRNA (adenine(1518)-N(6)/adenine(1519)-N(6))-dimethyltransferase RsmA [Polyangia bacterium]
MTALTDDPRRVLARHGLSAKKSWGQNFLRDRAVLARIAAAARATADDVVVEIGAGLGSLTTALCAAEPPPARVVAIERDPDMLRVLAAELADEPRVEVVAADAARFDLGAAARAAGRPIVVVGNLPYQIASALVLAVIEAGRAGAVARAVVMVQREMAKRITAPPGSRVYGRLTVAVAQHAEARLLFDVKPGSFHPAPSVVSSVLSLVPRATPLAPVRAPALFDEVVKRAFAMRRKMLRRALAAGFGEEAAAAALAASGIAGTRRAEELSVAEFARLADAFADAGVAPVPHAPDDDHA